MDKNGVSQQPVGLQVIHPDRAGLLDDPEVLRVAGGVGDVHGLVENPIEGLQLDRRQGCDGRRRKAS